MTTAGLLLFVSFGFLLTAGARRLILGALLAACAAGAFGQAKPATPAAPSPAPAQQAPEQAEQVAQAISLADVAIQAEAALAQLRQLENRGSIDDLLGTSADNLLELDRDVIYRARETRQLLAKNTSLETITVLEEGWRDIETRALAITRNLTRSVQRLDKDLEALEALRKTWDETRKAAVDTAAPPEVLERVNKVRNSIEATDKRVREARADVLAQQDKSADMSARAAQSRQALAAASERAATRLLYRDSDPLWTPDFWAAWLGSFSAEAREDLRSQGAALLEYSRLHASQFVFHGLLFIGLVAALLVARGRVRALSAAGEFPARARTAFEIPVASAMLIAMLASTWFYPRPPRAMWIIFSIVGAVPVFAFVRQISERAFHSGLYAVLVFFLLDRLRLAFAPLPGISRVMFLAETVLAILLLVRALRRLSRSPHAASSAQQPMWKILRLAGPLFLMLAGAAMIANIAGFVRLAELMVRTGSTCAYIALVMYALTRVGEGLLQGLMHVPPISSLAMVKRDKRLLTTRINSWLRWIAFYFWIAFTLKGPGLLQPTLDFLKSVWNASATFGSLTVSVGGVLTFFFMVWATFLLSRFVRFVLEAEIFPKMRLDRGLPYAISRMVHYAILLSGLLLALGVLGVDMTRFTIVAGAFSVGIGFGLQNIVNNFVSGLIVLFERPIKVGDTIQIGDMIGRVQYIGIRASVVRSTAGSEVIIPNGKLISDTVTNWTLSSQLRQISVPVITRQDIDVAQFKERLLEIARNSPAVVETPAPEALFIKRGLDNFEFELRAWTDQVDAWLEVRSDLTTGVNEALRQAPAEDGA